jgi:hypothetical protein
LALEALTFNVDSSEPFLKVGNFDIL